MIRSLFLIAILTPIAALAQLTHPGGSITSNTVWSVAQSPVTINGDLTIAAGVTLTIQPGVTVRAAATDSVMKAGGTSQVDIFVDGALQVTELAGFPVVFTGTGTANNAWGGFIVSSTGSLVAGNTEFQRMTRGLQATGSTITLNNSSFLNTAGCLTVGNSASNVTISGTTFAGCTGPAVVANGGTINVSSSVFRDTSSSAGAVFDVTSATVTIDRSTVSYNSTIGVLGDCGNGSVNVTNSIVSHNGSVGFRRYNFCSVSAASVAVSYSDVWGNAGTGVAMPPTNASSATSNYDLVTPGTSTQSANPLFTNGGGTPRDFTLTSTSPCIGQGRVGAVPGGMVIDQGAYPFVVGPITTVVVSPSNPSVAAGGTLLFGATAYDANNNPVNTTFTWAASTAAGTIGATGALTASCTPGTATNGVSATAPNGVVGRTNVTITLGAPNNLAITPPAATVKSQGTQQYTAAVRDSCNNAIPGATITWNAPGQAGSMSATGLFTAGCSRGPYANAISATSGTITGRTDVTVGPGDVAAIGLNPQNPSVQAGMTQLFAATAADGCGNTVMNAPITWTTNAPGSTISVAGIFTAGQTNGTFPNAVSATTPGATMPVTNSTGVTITGGSGTTVASISITPTTATLAVGGTQQFTATALNAQGGAVPGTTITWSVVNGGGSITPGGLFTAGNVAGTFANTVRAAAGSITATVSVTVNPGPIATIVVTPTTATLAPGGMTTFTAQPRDAFNNQVASTIAWSSLSAAGTITQGGVFTASSATGVYNSAITATVGSVSGSASVTIQAGALASLTMTPALAMVQAGGTVGFSVVGRDSSGMVVSTTPTFSVVNGGGTINASTGIFTAGTSSGTFANTVKAEASGLTAFSSVQVTPGPVLTVSVNPANVTVASGASQQFTAEARDAFNNVIPAALTWSAQPASGTISAGGLFVAGQAGVYPNAVTASASGINGFASVTVTAAGGGTAGGSSGGGMAGGSSGGGMAGGSSGGGGAAGGSAGGMAGGEGGGTSSFGGGSPFGGGSGGGGGMTTPPRSSCGCTAFDPISPMVGLAVFALLRRRRKS